MVKPLDWLSKIFRGDQGYSGYADPMPIDPSVFSYESWKDRTLANKQHMGMVPSDVYISGTGEDQFDYKGFGPGYQPLHERTETMYVNPALAGTTSYDSWYPEADFDIETGELSGDLSKKEFYGRSIHYSHHR